jgi:hypothetical protein
MDSKKTERQIKKAQKQKYNQEVFSGNVAFGTQFFPHSLLCFYQYFIGFIQAIFV